MGVVKAVEQGYINIERAPQLKNALDLVRSLKSTPMNLEVLDNYWFVGLPGTGKSRGARLRWPGLYNKPLNKWWTEYAGQETVLLDDFSLEHACLGAHVKHWADHYPFTAESKGGGCVIRPKRIVVTSNYSVS